MAMAGLTEVEMAANLGVSRQALYLWRKQYPDFEAACKTGKQVPDDIVEDSLFNRAAGKIVVREVKTVRGADGEIIKKETTVKNVPPDPTSMIFWLKNRRRDKWRERVENELSLDTNPLNIKFEKDGDLNAANIETNEVLTLSDKKLINVTPGER
jgi:DNA-binding XRE family transcriptional regulator